MRMRFVPPSFKVIDQESAEKHGEGWQQRFLTLSVDYVGARLTEVPIPPSRRLSLNCLYRWKCALSLAYEYLVNQEQRASYPE